MICQIFLLDIEYIYRNKGDGDDFSKSVQLNTLQRFNLAAIFTFVWAVGLTAISHH